MQKRVHIFWELVHTRLFYNKLKCQILELFKTEYYIDEMSVQKYPSLVVMSDFDRMDCWWK